MNLDSLLHKPVSRIWSPMQEVIYQSSGPIIVQAVAGSGKTTTIVELMNRRGGDAVFLAFNKAIQMELATRVNGQTVLTLNALGHRILMRKWPSAKLDQWRVSKRLRQIMHGTDYADYGNQVARSISLAKSHAEMEPNEHSFLELMDAYELEIPSDLLHPMAKYAHRVWYELAKNQETFDFDDQLYIPIRDNWQFPLFDYIYVDETQDLSPIQHLMLARMVERGGVPIAVGDRAQAIYGFRGASSGSMDMLRQLFSMEELPLSITYRCALSITALAQQIVPHIQPRPGAPDGEVAYLAEIPQPSAFGPTDLIVCRNNAPIFELALQFIKAGTQCRVLSNFLEVLERFIEGFDCGSSRDLRVKLEAWYKKEEQACLDSGRYGRLAGIEDRYKTLVAFCDKFSTTADIIRAIRQLASSAFGPRIATVHKAKGLEADRVYILRPDLLPSPRATSEAQLQAEANLKYVAVTRAKNYLGFLPGGE